MKSLSTSALVIAAALGLAACSSASPKADSHSTTTSSTSTTQGVEAQSTTSTSGAAASSTSTTTPPETAAAGSPIQVTTPADGAAVASPMTVRGTSRLGSQTIQLVLSDGSGNVLCNASAVPTANGSFSATMRYAGSGQGSLAAFVSGAGGAREDLIQVPVHLGD